MSVARPAAAGVAMLVPLMEMEVQLLVATLLSPRAEMMPEPGMVMSGFTRLSAVGPQPENTAIDSALAARRVAPTDTAFLAVDGLNTVPGFDPELPAEKNSRKSGCVHMNSSTSSLAAV